MDRNIQIFVFDRYHHKVNGANIRFFSKGELVGTTVSASGRASVQVQDIETEIEVKVEYKGQVKEAILAQDQNTYDFVYDISVKEPFIREYFPSLVGLGLIIITVTLVFIVGVRTNFEKQIVLILISLGAGGIASLIPGFLNVRLTLGKKLAVSAAGAMGIFVIIYFNVPSIADEHTDPDCDGSIISNVEMSGGSIINQCGEVSVDNDQ